MSEENWEKVERKVHDFRADDRFTGTLKDKLDSQYGGFDYLFKSEDGTDVLVFGKTALQSKLQLLSIGTKVRITYLGEKKSEKTGRTYEDYLVERMK